MGSLKNRQAHPHQAINGEAKRENYLSGMLMSGGVLG